MCITIKRITVEQEAFSLAVDDVIWEMRRVAHPLIALKRPEDFSFRSWRSPSAIKLVNVNKTYIVDTQITNFVS